MFGMSVACVGGNCGCEFVTVTLLAPLGSTVRAAWRGCFVAREFAIGWGLWLSIGVADYALWGILS